MVDSRIGICHGVIYRREVPALTHGTSGSTAKLARALLILNKSNAVWSELRRATFCRLATLNDLQNSFKSNKGLSLRS